MCGGGTAGVLPSCALVWPSCGLRHGNSAVGCGTRAALLSRTAWRGRPVPACAARRGNAHRSARSRRCAQTAFGLAAAAEAHAAGGRRRGERRARSVACRQLYVLVVLVLEALTIGNVLPASRARRPSDKPPASPANTKHRLSLAAAGGAVCGGGRVCGRAAQRHRGAARHALHPHALQRVHDGEGAPTGSGLQERTQQRVGHRHRRRCRRLLYEGLESQPVASPRPLPPCPRLLQNYRIVLGAKVPVVSAPRPAPQTAEARPPGAAPCHTPSLRAPRHAPGDRPFRNARSTRASPQQPSPGPAPRSRQNAPPHATAAAAQPQLLQRTHQRQPINQLLRRSGGLAGARGRHRTLKVCQPAAAPGPPARVPPDGRGRGPRGRSVPFPRIPSCPAPHARSAAPRPRRAVPGPRARPTPPPPHPGPACAISGLWAHRRPAAQLPVGSARQGGRLQPARQVDGRRHRLLPQLPAAAHLLPHSDVQGERAAPGRAGREKRCVACTRGRVACAAQSGRPGGRQRAEDAPACRRGRGCRWRAACWPACCGRIAYTRPLTHGLNPRLPAIHRYALYTCCRCATFSGPTSCHT